MHSVQMSGLLKSCLGAAIALALGACAEEAEEKSSTQAPSAAPSVTATSVADTGPAANAPAGDPALKDPCIEDMPTGKYGGSLIAGAYEDPKTFNPTLVTDSVSGRFVSYLFEALCEEDPTTYEVEPILAKSWEVSSDGLTYTFHMREGVKWHDGKPLTAKDVVFTYMEVLRNEEIPWDSRDVIKIDGQLPDVSAPDARTVVFKLPKAFAPFMRTASGVPILPEHVFGPWVREKGPNGKPLSNSQWGVNADPRLIIGSGAWMVENYQPGQRIVFKRNPHYFRTNRHKQPLPYLDRLEVPFLKNLETAILKFKAGETDAQWLPGKDFTYMKPLEAQGNFTIVNGGPDFRTSYFAFNLNPGKNKEGKPYVDPVKLKWFSDRRFRQAVSYAIDREAIIKNVFRGMGAQQNSPIFQKSPFYDPSVASYALNLDKAQALLAEAGFKRDGAVLKDPAGHAVEFTLLHQLGSKDSELEANMIVQDLKKLGITMKMQQVTFNVHLARTHETKDWDAVIGAWGAGIEPHGVAHLWTSHGQSHFFNLNPAKVPHPSPAYPWEKRIDELFAEGASTIDEAKRKRIYSEFQQLVMNEQIMIFLPVFNYTVAVRNSLGNTRPNPYNPLGISWNAWEIYRK
ncbi:MAG: ABC transporter substrate-binding protein [Candidatus Sericytochromatia bacterium]|nr:ABC transporter substrate-binding protein [Candidatus Sericytochromatia bacterium]